MDTTGTTATARPVMLPAGPWTVYGEPLEPGDFQKAAPSIPHPSEGTGGDGESGHHAFLHCKHPASS